MRNWFSLYILALKILKNSKHCKAYARVNTRQCAPFRLYCEIKFVNPRRPTFVPIFVLLIASLNLYRCASKVIVFGLDRRQCNVSNGRDFSPIRHVQTDTVDYLGSYAVSSENLVLG